MMRLWLLASMLPGVLLAPASAAQAGPADQMVGLFIQGCVAFAGNPADLRAWAQHNDLPEAPASVRDTFLLGRPGRVYDASAPDAKLALISSQGGLCSVATDQMTEAALVPALETGLQRAGLRFRLVIERNEKADQDIHDREYLATREGRGWRLLTATVKAGGRAMLTAGPE